MTLKEYCEKSLALYHAAEGRKASEVRLGYHGKGPAGQPGESHWTATIGAYYGSGHDEYAAVANLRANLAAKVERDRKLAQDRADAQAEALK